MPITIKIKRIVSILKYRSMNIFILSPHIYIIPASKKKRMPRDIKENSINDARGRLQKPALNVAALYGTGVNPDIKIAQVAYS